MGFLKSVLTKIDPAWMYFFMHICKRLIGLVDLILEALCGCSIVNGSKAERLEAMREDRTAHVVKVHLRSWMVLGFKSDLNNFLYTHEKYVDPEYILQEKNVIIYSFNETHTAFTVTDPEVDLFEIKKFPFTFIGQFYLAKRLVIIPHTTLHRLAHKIGDPKVNVTGVSMTARCGSTLLTQMVSRIPNTRAMGEPWALIHLNTLYTTGKISKAEMKELTLSGLRLLCKVEPDCRHLERIFLKFTLMNGPQFEVFHEVMPQMNLIFNTRQLVPSLKSLKKITANIQKNTIGDRWGFSWRWGIGFQLFPFDSAKAQMLIKHKFNTFFQKISDEAMFAYMTAGLDECYLKSKDMYKMLVLYEDLHDDPKAVITELMQIIDAPLEHLDLALEALQHDSQNNILAPRGDVITAQLTKDHQREIDDVFKELDVPLSCSMSFPEFKKVLSL